MHCVRFHWPVSNTSKELFVDQRIICSNLLHPSILDPVPYIKEMLQQCHGKKKIYPIIRLSYSVLGKKRFDYFFAKTKNNIHLRKTVVIHHGVRS